MAEVEEVKVSKLAALTSSDSIVMGVVRHVLTLAGGYLVAKGVADEATINEVIGSSMSILGVVWSIWVKR